jgi:hypothetical protein
MAKTTHGRFHPISLVPQLNALKNEWCSRITSSKILLESHNVEQRRKVPEEQAEKIEWSIFFALRGSSFHSVGDIQLI